MLLNKYATGESKDGAISCPVSKFLVLWPWRVWYRRWVCLDQQDKGSRKVRHQILGWEIIHVSLNINGLQTPYLRNEDSVIYSKYIYVP